jgi:hypothetical protein
MSEDSPSARVRQEPEQLHGSLVGWVIAAATVVTVACLVVVVFMLRGERSALGGVAEARGYPVHPSPAGIEQSPVDGPARGLERASKDRRALDEYGWVDRRRGIARIPIERAMSWLVDDARDGNLRSPDVATAADAGAPDGEH